MKILFIIISFLSLNSCKKAQENISIQVIAENFSSNKEWEGDHLISDLNFVNSIDSTCRLQTTFFDRSNKQIEKDEKNCTLSKIKFDYEKLNSLKTKISIGKINSTTELFIKKTQPKNNENADLFYQATLYIERNKVISDSITLYKSINFSEALTVEERRYFINNDIIYILDILEDESGSAVEKWMNYKININGKLELIKQKLFSTTNNVDYINSRNISNIWNGSYHFESTNRGDAKTTFDIVINSLEDVLVKINEDGSKETYPNIRAEVINSDKIRIKYNSSENEMGIIHIEKSADKFFISGNPIYFINPGTSEGELIKMK